MRKRSWDTAEVRFFKLAHEEVIRSLRRYAEEAVAKGAKAVILIGSLARGDYTAFSDADVIIISDDVPANPVERTVGFMDSTLPVEVEPRVYTAGEFLKMAEDGRRIVKEAVACGKLLAGSGDVIERASELLASQSREE